MERHIWITLLVIVAILFVLKSEIGKNISNPQKIVLPERSEIWDYLHSTVQYNSFLQTLSEKTGQQFSEKPPEITTEKILPETSSQLQ